MIDSIVFSFPEINVFGAEWINYLELRKKVLVDGLSWSLPYDGNLELDQYDTPLTLYSVALKDGEVIAGARAVPCCHAWNGWTYMLRDAALGKITAIPADLVDDLPTSSNVWECTRLVLDENKLAETERSLALQNVVNGLAKVTAQKGAASLLSLSPPMLQRVLSRFGYNCIKRGRTYRCAEDGRRYQVLTMPTTKMVRQRSIT